MFLWKIKFSLQQKEGSNDLVGPKYYVSSVGVPCCHCRMDKSFFKKALRYHTKNFFQDKILSGKYFSRKEWLNQIKQNRKKIYARLRTVRVCCVNQPPIQSLFTECCVYFIYVEWLSLHKMLREIVSLVQNARCPYFSKNGTSQVHTRMSKARQTTKYKCVLQLEV